MTFNDALQTRPTLISLVRQLDLNLDMVAKGNARAVTMVRITLALIEARGVVLT